MNRGPGGAGELILFVVTAGRELGEALRRDVVTELRRALSPRHVPDTIAAVNGVPRNLTGKKLELPVKRILQGADPSSVVSRDAMLDPSALDAYVELASHRER